MNETTISGKTRAIAATTIFHFVLLLFLIFMKLNNVTPPKYEEEGILVNFGTDEFGQGRLEPATDIKAVMATPPQSSAASGKKEIITQDYEEAPYLERAKEKKNTEIKIPTHALLKPRIADSKPTLTTTEPQQKVNTKALFPGNKSEGGNEGEGETGKYGNQGDPNGSRLTGNRIGGGNGNGNIPSFSLAGRGSLTLPVPNYSSQAEGRVVVEITVDREGNVVKANPTIKGSTVQDDKLFEAAKNAAMKAKFNVKSDAPAYQVGTITYNFRLQ